RECQRRVEFAHWYVSGRQWRVGGTRWRSSTIELSLGVSRGSQGRMLWQGCYRENREEPDEMASSRPSQTSRDSRPYFNRSRPFGGIRRFDERRQEATELS